MPYQFGLKAALAAAASVLALNASASPLVSWNSSNAIVDNTLSVTTLYGNTVPDGPSNGQLVWDPTEATSPGISVDNVTPPNSPPGATGCILAGGALCDDPRQSGKRFKLQATDFGPIDLMFDYTDDAAGNVDGLYRVFGKLTNATNRGIKGYTIELGTGVGDNFTLFDGSEGVTWYAPLNNPPKEFELASVFPAGLFSPAGVPLAGSGEGFFSDARSGFNLTYGPTVITADGIYGDYASLFGPGMMPLAAVPDGFFFDEDSDPTTDDILQAWFDDSTSTWLYGQAAGFAPVDAATLTAWAADPLYYVGEIEDLSNTNLNISIQFADAAPGQMTMRVTPEPVPVPAGFVLIGSVMAAGGLMARYRQRRQA